MRMLIKTCLQLAFSRYVHLAHANTKNMCIGMVCTVKHREFKFDPERLGEIEREAGQLKVESQRQHTGIPSTTTIAFTVSQYASI
jgi:hypothetical protein